MSESEKSLFAAPPIAEPDSRRSVTAAHPSTAIGGQEAGSITNVAGPVTRPETEVASPHRPRTLSRLAPAWST